VADKPPRPNPRPTDEELREIREKLKALEDVYAKAIGLRLEIEAQLKELRPWPDLSALKSVAAPRGRKKTAAKRR
jgi:hypothetical protein